MSIIVGMVMAMDRNQLIGKANGMPWHIPGEQVYFKEATLGKPVIMGRKTYDSIGRPLPGRQNIVVTRNADWQAEGVEVVLSLEAAIELAEEAKTEEVMIIGGAALCQLAMPLTHRLYLTIIDAAYEGDTWLHSYDASEWTVVSRHDVPANGDSPAYSVTVQERR